jgi:hypothetical protein
MGIRIKVVRENGHTSYYYYPSISCKTKDGEMKMLLNSLELESIPYKLEVELSPKP